ncbi:MAG: peroxiredoxin [Candidatus Bipolaricaulota bacterium]|nr:peroxiredoxin [Candidatus Bipolaricaulota bacterium]MCS7275201.1 peroxiredoxin [Candidatus Bipolaricaulota bacterium]MDW8111404.1 peroxiredoxin [Candidatus Bipolaricaulota bacterium]MDW8329659.1 peroxiredoxin [Candidatus Bipolaricaulota bacterium]
MELHQKAPDFTTKASDGERIEDFTLSKELGKEHIVLAFFPLAFTSVCTNEMCQFRDQMQQFHQLKARVYGISVDSPFALNAFIKANGLKFKLLSDFNKEISRAYGVLYEDLMGLKGVAKRSVFVLDKNGILRYKWVSEDPKVLPNFDEIQKVLQGLG